MNRLILVSGTFLLLGIHGCTPVSSTVAAPTPTNPPKPPTVTPAPVASATIPPPTLDPGQTDIPSELVSDQRFSEIYFTDSPARFLRETIFPLGIQEVFAVWHYVDMQPRDFIRQVWLHNGTVWIQREEAWDYDEYGSTGWMTDVSIHDYVDGLPTGNWELQVYVNDVLQTSTESVHTFRVELIREWQTRSPDGTHMALVENKNALVVDGQTIAIADPDTDNQLGRFDWYPDSQHLFYTEKLRDIEWISGPRGPRYKLWVVNVANGDLTLVAGEEDYVHTPVISPDGKHAAVVQGNGFGDACSPGWTLGIVSIRDDLTLSDPVLIHEYTGFSDAFDSVYPMNAPDLERPGKWEDAEHLVVALNFTCTDLDSVATLPGIYRINITDHTVDRISDLPPEAYDPVP